MSTRNVHKHPGWERFRDEVRRCTIRSRPGYAGYGGRGIGLDPAWPDASSASFQAWLEHVESMPGWPGSWDEVQRLGLQIDRADNDGGYTKGNMRWVTPSENLRNRRSYRRPDCAVHVPFARGVRNRDLAAYYGVSERTVRQRLNQDGRGVCGLTPTGDWGWWEDGYRPQGLPRGGRPLAL